MSKNPCLGCGCYDPDMGCSMPDLDKWYACSLEANEEELREMFEEERGTKNETN